MITNPFVEGRNLPQFISWKHLKNGETYELELINPGKFLFYEYANGGYMIIPTKVLKDGKLSVLEMLKGERVVVSIPIRTFSHSWMMLPRLFRQQFQDGDNLYIKFIKNTQKDLSVLDVARVKCEHEEKKFFDLVQTQKEAYISVEQKYSQKPKKVIHK